MRRARLSLLLPLALACVPPALAVAMAARYGLNVPWWDEFDFIPILSEAFEGHLRLTTLWDQHNEHRLFLPWLIMLGLAKLSDWDLRYGLAANITVGLAQLAVLVSLIRRTVRALAPSLAPWLVLAASLTTFLPAEGENWLWGFQLVVFMDALAAVLTVWALARWGTRWPALALGLLGALAGALSFASGLLLPILVAGWFVVQYLHHEGRVSRRKLAVAVVVPAGIMALYFLDFHGALPSVYHPFSRPLSYGLYVLVYMGAGLSFEWRMPIAASWGAAGLVVFASSAAWLWRRSAIHREALLPWLILALYAILTALMTGAGRIGVGGLEVALAPRYVTLSALFWVSTLVTVALAIADLLHEEALSQGRAVAVVAVATSLLTLGAVSHVLAWTSAAAGAKARYERLLRGRECLADYRRAPDECLQTLYYLSADVTRGLAQRLERLALGPFAPSQRERPLSSYTIAAVPGPTGTAGFIDHVAVTHAPALDRMDRFDEVVVSGWAMDPFARRQAAAVLVVVDGHVMGRASTGQPRPDVSKVGRRSRSGWTFRLGAFRLDPGPHLVEAYAVLDHDRRLVRLEGARMLETHGSAPGSSVRTDLR